MAEMSLQVQIQRISNLKSQLDLLVNRVKIIKDEMNAQLNLALQNGLPIEIYQTYKIHYLSTLYNSLDTITTRIMRDDKGYLNDVETTLRETKNHK